MEDETSLNRPAPPSAPSAFQFVLTLGVVNLFADMTYDGGASINGPLLGTIGASAAAISIIAGFGEFLGYSLRAVSGYISDKTGRYWLVTFVGYSINLLAVPAMALAGLHNIDGRCCHSIMWPQSHFSPCDCGRKRLRGNRRGEYNEEKKNERPLLVLSVDHACRRCRAGSRSDGSLQALAG